MSGGKTLDLFEGKRRRNAGMQQAESGAGNWSLVARSTADHWLSLQVAGTQFTGESVRLFVLARLTIRPRHPNAWGAVIGGSLRRWLRAGRIRRIGLGQAHDPRSHASMLPLYEITSSTTQESAP